MSRWVVMAALVALGGCGGTGGGSDGATPLDGGVVADGGVGGGQGTWYDRRYQDGNGARDYHVYVPYGYDGHAAPLVMVLHGCTQTARDAARMSRYPALADEKTALVVFPEEDPLANPARCWNWFLADDQARDHGEPAILAGIVDAVAGEWSIEPTRVFVIGGSAGAAMAVILGATWPDRFAAIGVIAGCEYAGEPCGPTGGPDPKQQGLAAYHAMGSHARAVPVLVFQGDADPFVAPVNADQLVTQWLTTDDWADDGALDGSAAAATPTHASGQVPGGRSYDIDRWLAPSAAMPVVVERWTIHGGGHAWPGGPAGATFTDPEGPDATALSWAFFAAHPRP